MKRDTLPTLVDSSFRAPPESNDDPVTPYRVQFSTETIKPRGLPDFPYVATKLTFDSVIYTAVIRAASLQAALESLSRYWPDAQPREAQENVNSFAAGDTGVSSNILGAQRVEPRKSRWFSFLGGRT